MSTIKIEGFIIQSPHWDKDDPLSFMFSASEMSTDGYATICPHTLEFTLPSRDVLVAKQVAALKGELQKVRAENHLREKRIEDRIANLLSLDAPR